ncbi:TPA: glycosyltransferase family 52, partial [Streptococcus suis]
MESKLSTQQKSDIIALFINSDIQHSIEALSDAKIVLTQPLSEDGYITEQEKIGKYLGIIRDLERSNVVILKKHPRDKTRYDFENVIVLDGTFPSEIFNLLNIVFDTAISICSSSIDNINAHRKI